MLNITVKVAPSVMMGWNKNGSHKEHTSQLSKSRRKKMIRERLSHFNLFNSPLLTTCMRSHSVKITTLKFHFILRYDRVVTGKDTTPTMHPRYHTYYIMSHQKLAYNSWLIFI